MKILMVCLGNICRSPLAEGVLKHKISKAGLNWQVDSAGTSHYNTGTPPHKLSQKVAKLNGFDICEHCCRQFVQEDMIRFDKIYVMDKENYRDVKRISRELWDPNKVEMLLNEVYPNENREVPDPWYGDEEDYHKVYKMIDEACDRIVAKGEAPTLKSGERTT
jgi:protein-tyrosine phosphatase